MKRLVLFAVLAVVVVWGGIYAYNYIFAPREEVLYSYTFPTDYMSNHMHRGIASQYNPYDNDWMIAGLLRIDKTNDSRVYVLINGKPVPMDEPDQRIPGVGGPGFYIYAIRSKGESLILLNGKLIGSVKQRVLDVSPYSTARTVIVETPEGEFRVEGDKLMPFHRDASKEKEEKWPDIKVVKKTGEAVLLKNGKQIDKGHHIILGGSSDKKHLVYAVTSDMKHLGVIVDGKETCEIELKEPVTKDPGMFIEYNDDGSRYFILINTDTRQYICLDNGLVDSAPWLQNITFSPDGRKVAYTAFSKRGYSLRDEPDYHAKVDGQDLCPGFRSRILGFSPDSSKLAVVKVLSPGRWIEREVMYPKDSPPVTQQVLVSRKERVFINGRAAGPVVGWVDINPDMDFFSPDSEHHVYKIDSKERGAGYRIVVDGRIVPPSHDSLSWGFAWHKDCVAYWTMDYPHEYRLIAKTYKDMPVDYPEGTEIRLIKIRLRE